MKWKLETFRINWESSRKPLKTQNLLSNRCSVYRFRYKDTFFGQNRCLDRGRNGRLIVEFWEKLRELLDCSANIAVTWMRNISEITKACNAGIGVKCKEIDFENWKVSIWWSSFITFKHEEVSTGWDDFLSEWVTKYVSSEHSRTVLSVSRRDSSVWLFKFADIEANFEQYFWVG